MSAVISNDGLYRYVLRRSLGVAVRWYKPMLFIMLNPSTADASVDDPTIRRCMNFAKREGMTHLNVVNLFALRASDPKELAKVSNPLGIDNRRYIEEEIRHHSYGAIIAAWGANPFAHDRARQFTKEYGPFMCLGKTKDGSPRHPLYVKSDTELEQYP